MHLLTGIRYVRQLVLRFADGTTLLATNATDLKDLLKVKAESEAMDLKLNERGT